MSSIMSSTFGLQISETMRCAGQAAKSRREKKFQKRNTMAKIRSRLGRVFGRVWEFWHDFKKWRRDAEEARQRRADRYDNHMVNPDDIW
ncbi:hypothetical protein BCON_0151g00070 [Botryotinia convoluta]|uniref:Uncharacterized protein n=1 Tax=Botryotinia convoluta TaxID=54673 RepID=A0A4Z1I4R6_9HELO|nr:hypothetical protein BCON_0151g00070 [Botryotinia convoluta]